MKAPLFNRQRRCGDLAAGRSLEGNAGEIHRGARRRLSCIPRHAMRTIAAPSPLPGRREIRHNAAKHPAGAETMLRCLFTAAIAAALSAGAARAQIHDITSAVPEQHQYGWGMWPAITTAPVPEDAGREHDIDVRYRETLRTKLPDRKRSNDPWRTIRAAPAEPFDRHKVE
jgi:hypothetical protein